MNWKASKLYSIFYMKCPRCHEGDMFPSHSLYKPTKFDKMNASCSHCKQSFEPEPGFYFGAMFVSYAINTFLFIASWIILYFLVEEVTLWMMIAVLLVVVVGFLPVIFRLSRAIWINIFVSYKGSYQENTKSV